MIITSCFVFVSSCSLFRPLRKAVSYGLGVALFKILPNFAEFALCGLHHFCEYANGVPRLRGPTVAAIAAPYPKNALVGRFN